MRKMKYFSLVALSILLFTSCGFSQDETKSDKNTSSNTEESFVKNVDVSTFKELIETGEGIILDVRTPEEVAAGYIQNASTINIYDADFEKKINLMQKDKEIYIYCRSGARSAQAAKILSKNGFKRVYNMEGGMMSWERNRFPVVKPTNSADNNIQTFSLTDFNTLINQNDIVLVDFHTVWCAPCKKMAPIIDGIEKEYSGKAIVKRVDVEKSSDVGEAFDITGVPVFTLFVNGEKKWTHNGMISKAEITKEIDQYLK